MDKTNRSINDSFWQNFLGYLFVFLFVVPVIPYLIYKFILSI